jgi:hypothetical protein
MVMVCLNQRLCWLREGKAQKGSFAFLPVGFLYYTYIISIDKNRQKLKIILVLNKPT